MLTPVLPRDWNKDALTTLLCLSHLATSIIQKVEIADKQSFLGAWPGQQGCFPAESPPCCT